VYFNNNDGDVEIDEFAVSASDPTVADRGSRRQVIVINHRMADNHNGGQMNFGPSGPLLYFATGDGGAGQRANAANLDVLLGKVIRIDPRQRGAQPYRIPASNPYVGAPGRDEILAYGLRNPWRWSFDGSHVIIGDVGQSSWEEIDAIRLADLPGMNFGWPQFEGNELFEPTLPGPDPPTFPVHTYSHDPTEACAITGGYVVRDPALPRLKDRYVYADFCTGQMRSIRIDFSQAPPIAHHDTKVGITLPGINTFGRGLGGEIYFARRTGQMYRLDPPAG
jgi:glucose/arabinose dehydrogenase